MTAQTTKPALTLNRFIEGLRKNAANGKTPHLGVLNIPPDLRLGAEDYQAISRDAFHHLPENTQIHRLENGMVACVRGTKWTEDDSSFVEHVRETLEEVIERQGLGTIPKNLWSRFRWPEDDERLGQLLGIPLSERLMGDGWARFDMSEMLRGAITTEAVFDSCRRQAILSFDDTRRQILGHEIYCSLDYLRQHHLASFLLEGPGELEILSRVLDEKVMEVTRTIAPSILPDKLHLNMRVQTVLSDTFAEFVNHDDGKLIKNMAIEFSMENAIANWWEFEDACEFLHSSGIEVGLDRITLPALEFLSPRKMNVDFIKVIWDHNIIGSRRTEVAERLREFASLFVERSLILTRCDSRTALRMGRSLGVEVFQGSYIDAMLGSYLHRECKSKRRSTDKRCAVCQWAPREARKNGCNFHFRSGKRLAEV
ncbi:EAL domain-containing protein [Thalassospira povalilytica]|uniref:EAL domain-containing protein n=1 Tax=Thalassospira povalilytica TaxID=732237 RepID=UPI001D18936D|nr:EAL domain-containing protein [Thalassospira povalilytica]MCC4240613.1 EAL domain-containing protein [Thalassospira povalilytica]